jgi:release factor glutamine methyltransferase
VPRTLTPTEINHLIRTNHTHLLDQITDETPVEYLTHTAYFCDLAFYVDEHVLIPRIESEQIVEDVIKHITTRSYSPLTIADVGTGSGALGISISRELEEKKINHTLILTDISPEALEVAEKNAVTHLSRTPHLVQSHLLTALSITPDIIVANLPYIPSERIETLDASVQDFEPHLALDGGLHGYEIINNLLDQIEHRDTHPSFIYLEVDSSHQLSDFDIPNQYTARVSLDVFDRPRFLILEYKNSRTQSNTNHI